MSRAPWNNVLHPAVETAGLLLAAAPTAVRGRRMQEARRKLLESAAEQIENAVPDLEQRVNQSNQQELELNMESGQSMI